MHLKAATCIKCFINVSLYNNFNEENKVDVLWKKIGTMFENKNTMNRVSIFRKIVRLQYKTTPAWRSISMPSKDLPGSLPDGWETLVVTLGNAGLEGKHLTLEQVKSSLLKEEAHRKDTKSIYTQRP